MFSTVLSFGQTDSLITKEEKLFSLKIIFSDEEPHVQRVVYGTVKDDEGQPIPWLTIQVDNTMNAIQTDTDGKYAINAYPKDTLIFSYIGMVTQKIRADITELNVQMEYDEPLKDEVGLQYNTKMRNEATTFTVTDKDIKDGDNLKYSCKRNAQHELKKIDISNNTKIVKGIVIDKFGPIAGAYIEVKHSLRNTHADIDGKFEIMVKKGEVLIVSFVGLGTTEIKIDSKDFYEITIPEYRPPMSRKMKRYIRRNGGVVPEW